MFVIYLSGGLMSKIILVTGGARSGKSTFAEKLAAKIHSECKNDLKHKAYIATAQILDDEMAQRIKMHQARRDKEWRTFEAPFNAELSIEAADEIADVILFDCLTIYISNFVCAFNSLDDTDKIYSELKSLVNNLIEAAKKNNGTIIFVTNEVGSGIVPANKLSRVYRDCAGIANQMIAIVADEVYMVVSGIAFDIKKIAINI